MEGLVRTVSTRALRGLARNLAVNGATRSRRIAAIRMAGVASILSCGIAHAENFTVLHSFAGGSDGATPGAEPIIDKLGNIFGTTEEGGVSGSCSAGCGTVYKISSEGAETVIYKFKDAMGPHGRLHRDK